MFAESPEVLAKVEGYRRIRKDAAKQQQAIKFGPHQTQAIFTAKWLRKSKESIESSKHMMAGLSAESPDWKTVFKFRFRSSIDLVIAFRSDLAQTSTQITLALRSEDYLKVQDQMARHELSVNTRCLAWKQCVDPFEDDVEMRKLGTMTEVQKEEYRKDVRDIMGRLLEAEEAGEWKIAVPEKAEHLVPQMVPKQQRPRTGIPVWR